MAPIVLGKNCFPKPQKAGGEDAKKTPGPAFIPVGLSNFDRWKRFSMSSATLPSDDGQVCSSVGVIIILWGLAKALPYFFPGEELSG